MNFIGHLHVARWYWMACEMACEVAPPFLLGAMLPDFATMGSVKLGAPADALVRAGIAFHHRTDEAFHHQPEFIALMQQTLSALSAQGVARGPARAVGHIGVEMLIDGELVHARGNSEAYVLALEQSAGLDQDPALAVETRAGLSRVHRRLRAHGVPYDYRNTEAVVTRLSRALSGRPRLAISPEDAQKVAIVLPEIQRQVVSTLPALLAAVRAALLNEGVLAE